MSIGWKVGVELELMAPRGRSRLDLAQELAGRGGRVERFFHPQSEPSMVPNMGVFESLTPGFRAFDASGVQVASVVDDLTLVDGLDSQAASREGWYRVVSDDLRLLHLVRRHAGVEGDLRRVLAPVAALFGTELREAHGMVKVVDEIGGPVCIGARLPGERDRPAELVTPPISANDDLQGRLETLLSAARRLGFSVPTEAATHLHFDATRLERAGALANLVELLHTWGPALREHVRTNPRCVRLGPMPDALLEVVRATDFRTLSWKAARERLEGTRPSKYVDFNVKNLVHTRDDKHTFEIRILPGSLSAAQVHGWAALFAAVLWRAVAPEVVRAQAPRDDLPALWGMIGWQPGSPPLPGNP